MSALVCHVSTGLSCWHWFARFSFAAYSFAMLLTIYHARTRLPCQQRFAMSVLVSHVSNDYHVCTRLPYQKWIALSLLVCQISNDLPCLYTFAMLELVSQVIALPAGQDVPYSFMNNDVGFVRLCDLS